LAKNIKYEVKITSDATIQSEWIKDFDNEKFMNLIYNNVINGKTKAYDFYDNSVLTEPELREQLGLISDTFEIENPETKEISIEIYNSEFDPSIIESYIFIEDWYYNPETYSIYKKVKAIAPVRYMIREDGTLAKVICFVVKFSEK